MPVAAACGQRPLSPADIAVRRREGFYRTVWPDTHYAGSVEPPPYPALLRASCLCVRDGVISHLSAARLWGLKVPPGTDLHVTVPRENWRRRDGVELHRDALAAADRTERHGVPVTTLARSLIDAYALIERRADQRALVVETFRKRRCTRARLTAGGSHSAGEMRLYELMESWRLPIPKRQLVPELPRGRPYLDCALPAYRMAFEYDGDLHLTDAQKHDDLLRDQLLRRLGWHTFRVTELRMADERRLVADIWQDICDQARPLSVPVPPTPPRLKG